MLKSNLETNDKKKTEKKSKNKTIVNCPKSVIVCAYDCAQHSMEQFR